MFREYSLDSNIKLEIDKNKRPTAANVLVIILYYKINFKIIYFFKY